jgi:hypothetical protein
MIYVRDLNESKNLSVVQELNSRESATIFGGMNLSDEAESTNIEDQTRFCYRASGWWGGWW